MKNTWIFGSLVLTLAFGGLSAAELEVRYELPLLNEGTDILPVPLRIIQTSDVDRTERTDFGVRVHKPMVSIITREEAKTSPVLVKKSDALQAELANPSLPWIRVQTSAVPVLFQVRRSFSDGFKIETPENGIDIELSSIQFDQEDAGFEFVRYQLFIGLDDMPPVFRSDIRSDFKGSVESYLEKYARYDESFEVDQEPKKGLRENRFRKREGYVFSSCAVFKDQPIVDRIQRDGLCYEYSLSQRGSAFPVIAGNRLPSYPNAAYLYVIERERKLRNSDKIERHWVKLAIPSQTAVSLKDVNWKSYSE